MRDASLVRLDSLVALVNEKIITSKDRNKRYVGLEHLPSGGSSLLGTAESGQSVSANNVFRAGDVLFGKLRPRLRKSVQAPFDGYCSTDILVLRPKAEVVPIFAGFVLQSDAVFAEAIRTEEGTKMPRCSWVTLKDLRVYCPQPRKQQRIAEILSTVDEAIEQTEALIAKTQQIKAGLMNDLFTRGVTADGQLRPPREEAPQLYKESPLGWIPRDWLAPLIDAVATRGSGHTPSQSHAEYWNGGVKWLSLADSWQLDETFVSITEKEISAAGLANSSAVLLPAGTVVISRDGSRLGKSGILGTDMAVSQHFIAWTCGPSLDNIFLYWSLQYRKREFENVATGSTIPTIGLQFFKRLRIGCPSERQEQERIGRILLSIHEDLVARRSEQEKLCLLRAGLRADLLTGRVRVTVADSARVPDVAFSTGWDENAKPNDRGSATHLR